MKAAPRSPRTWLTIHEASDLVGVSPATLRRWTESGDVDAFVTPGGHRRFARSSIMELLPRAVKRRRSLQELGETPDRVVRQYRREIAERPPAWTWMERLDESQRAAFRESGRLILTGVLGFLDAESAEASEASLTDALRESAGYGALARERDIDIDGLTEAFLGFRVPFLHELGRIARRRRLHADETVDLLLAALRVFDRLVVAMLRAYRDPGGPAAAPSGVR